MDPRPAARRGDTGEACRDQVQPARSLVAADVHRAVPALWSAALPVPPHAPAKCHGAGAGGVPEHRSVAGIPGDLNAALTEYLARVTDRVIREAVYKDTGDAEEVAEPEKLGRWRGVSRASRRALACRSHAARISR